MLLEQWPGAIYTGRLEDVRGEAAHELKI